MLFARIKTLKTLVIGHIENGDLTEVCEACPGLESLYLHDGEWAVSLVSNELVYSQLRVLDFSLDIGVSSSVIEQVLVRATKLTELRISAESDFNDAQFNAVLDQNPLKHLRKLTVCLLPHLTAQVFWRLLKGDNELEKLTVWECGNLCENDYRQMVKYCDEKRLNLTIKWYDSALGGYL